MKKVYKAHILFTKEQSHFEVFENGYITLVYHKPENSEEGGKM